MDEFGMGSISSSYFGTVKNPWNLKENNGDDDFYISGGSSGGSAVSVALDICDFSIGNVALPGIQLLRTLDNHLVLQMA